MSELLVATKEVRIAENPQLFQDETVELRSSLLGCDWKVTVPCNELGLRIGEAFLGFFEALFATSLDGDAFAHRQRISILISENIDPLELGSNFRFELEKEEHLIFIEYSPAYESRLEIVSQELRRFLRDCAVSSISKILIAQDVSSYFERFAKAEEGFSRAANFADIFTSVSNIFGERFSVSLDQWTTGHNTYPCVTTESSEPLVGAETVLDGKPLKFGSGEAPAYLKSTAKLQHGHRRVLSIFNVDLWDRARWQGVLIGLQPSSPPIFGLMFQHSEEAIKIFEGWRRLYGNKDIKDEIRISIIRNVDRNSVSTYTVLISANFETEMRNAAPLDQFLIVNRVNKMINPNPMNLSTFLSAYEQYGCYFLAPVLVRSPADEPRIVSELMLLKRGLRVRDAWTLGEHEPDMMAISADDDPLIPDGIVDPPIMSHIRRRRQPR